MATTKVRDYAKLASDIKDSIGEQNIVSATHCATRLRLVLKQSPSAEVTKKISEMPAVIQVVEKGGQYQIVIGTHAKDVYEALSKIIDVSDAAAGGPKQTVMGLLISTISGCMSPFIYILAAAGLIQGCLLIINLIWPAFAATGTNRILDFISWTPFTFMPVMIAITASKHFKCNTYIAAWCCLALVNNSWAEIAALISGGETIKFLFFPMAETTYTSTVIPAIILVFVLSKLEKWLEKRIPDVFKAIFVPLICTAVMVPLTFIVIGPLTAAAANGIAWGYNKLFDAVPWLASTLLGGLFQTLVVFGVHWGTGPIQLENFRVFGYDTIQAMASISVCAQTVAGFAVFFKSRNKEVKNVTLSAAITGLFGITEPVIYGVNLRFKKPFICASISAAIGSLVASFFGTRYFVYAGLCGFLTVVNGIDPTGNYPNSFMGLIIGTAVACVLTFILVQIVGFDDPVPAVETGPEEEGAPQLAPASAGSVSEFTLYAPLNGELKPISEVNDPTFADGILGQGVAILPSDGKLYAPFDCTVESVFDTHHAINLDNGQGVELLLHIGLDTVALNGKYFKAMVKDGDKVKAGDLLIEFDIEAIKKTHEVITPILVTNADDVSEVAPVRTSGAVKVGDPVVTIKV